MAKLKNTSLDLNPIIKRLEQSKVVSADGKISYQGFFFDDFIAVLEHSVDFSSSVPERERLAITTNALFSPYAKPFLTQNSILEAINRLETDYLSTSRKTLIVATSISLPPSLRMKPIRYRGATITFSSSLPEKFSRKQYEKELLENSHDPSPRGYQSVRLRVQSRSKSEAIDTAIDTLDFIRALWNFGINRRVGYEFPQTVITPINRIRLGQVHTLYFVSGKVADDNYLYEPSFILNKTPESIIGSRWSNAKKDERQLRALIKKSLYRDALVSAMLRYNRALDSLDFESGYIKLWSLLEFLTGTVEGRTDDLIGRCLFLYGKEDREFQRQVLNHLRNRRHRFVHVSEQSVVARELVFQLKRYVENMILFHLQNTGRFANIADAASFLSLPYDVDILRKRVSRLKLAIKVRT